MPSERFPLHAKTLREGASALIGVTDVEEADKIIVPEAMGFHIGGVLSAITGKPFIPIARETGKMRRYVDDVSGRELGERISIYKSTGYEVTEMFVYGLKPGDKVILIDTIISTGGTGIGIIKGLRKEGIKVLDFAAYVMKVDYHGGEKIEKETGIEPKSLINLSIKDVYEKDGRTYAETTVEKSRWWSRGESASKELEEAWRSFESKIHHLQKPKP
jgi:adenine phosphoribosyltransferase